MENDVQDDRKNLVAPELAGPLSMMPGLDFSTSPSEFRAVLASWEVPPLPSELAAVDCKEIFVPGLAGSPPVRVLQYTPRGNRMSDSPALLYIHGGGYVVGSPEWDDASSRTDALTLGIPVISVDYRLAPETRWPGAVEDCFAALLWMHNNAASIGIDPGRIAVAGQSAGGGHAAALALYARDKAKERSGCPAICFLLLDSPMLDDRTGVAPNPHPFVGHFIWTPEMNRFGWRSLLGMEPGGADVPHAAVPARAEGLAGLPPTFLGVGALDLFLEENIEWIRRLTRAGVAAELHVVPGAFHGFTRLAGTPQADQFADLKQIALARGLGLSLK